MGIFIAGRKCKKIPHFFTLCLVISQVNFQLFLNRYSYDKYNLIIAFVKTNSS